MDRRVDEVNLDVVRVVDLGERLRMCHRERGRQFATAEELDPQ
jgi:hypothetical protein